MGKVDWACVGEANRKEYNSTAKWYMERMPEHDLCKYAFAELTKNPSRNLRKELHDHDVIKESFTEVCSFNNTECNDLRQSGSAEESDREQKKAHCHRKHRKDCPKHLMNALKRKGIPTGTRAEKHLQNDSVHLPSPMPPMKLPNAIGSGVARLVSGVFDPAQRHTEKRWIRDYPDYAKLSASRDADVLRLAPHVKPHHPLPEQIRDDNLVADIIDKKHNRLKYDMKTHMESLKLMGTALLREFSGAAFK